MVLACTYGINHGTYVLRSGSGNTSTIAIVEMHKIADECNMTKSSNSATINGICDLSNRSFITILQFIHSVVIKARMLL